MRNVIKTLEDKEEGMDIHDEEDEEEESILTKKQILIRSPAMLISYVPVCIHAKRYLYTYSFVT